MPSLFSRRCCSISAAALITLSFTATAQAQVIGFALGALGRHLTKIQQDSLPIDVPPGATGYVLIDTGMFTSDAANHVTVCDVPPEQAAHDSPGCWRKASGRSALVERGAMLSPEVFVKEAVGPKASYIGNGTKGDGRLIIFFNNATGS